MRRNKGAQGALCHSALVKVAAMPQSSGHLLMEASDVDAQVLQALLNVQEKVSLDRMLDECNGIPWCPGTLELGLVGVKITQSRNPYKYPL